MTNPNNAIGTNSAYNTRTSVDAFNDICQLAGGRGVLSGWAASPKTGMTVQVGGVAGTRDVAIAEDNLGNLTTINNRSAVPVEITIAAASSTANRYDAIVAYVNNPPVATTATPIPQDAPSVCGIIDVQGGTTGVTEAQIRTAITADGATGSTAFYVVLATVFVGAGTTTITTANISSDSINIPGALIEDNSIASGQINWSTFTYSATPVRIGTWTDGKPIYRAVISGTTANSGEENVTMSLPNFYACLNHYGSIIRSSGQSTPIPRVTTAGLQFQVGIGDIDGSGFYFQHAASGDMSRPYFIVFEYIATA